MIMKTKTIQSAKTRQKALTLTELVVGMALTTIVILTVSMLVAGGHKAWNRSFDNTHKEIRIDAERIMLSFGATVRKCNRLDYTLYTGTPSSFSPVSQTLSGENIYYGDAVEFHFWDVDLSFDLLDVAMTGTAYALFYIDGDQLKLDVGPYPPGGIPYGGGARNTSDVTTRVIASNVTVQDGQKAFSHTAQGATGLGCVRLHVNLTDPEDGETIRVMTSSMMRNIWPR